MKLKNHTDHLEWSHHFDQNDNSYWEAVSPIHDELSPFYWRLRQRFFADKRQWYQDHDKELPNCGTQFDSEYDAKAHIESKHRTLSAELLSKIEKAEKDFEDCILHHAIFDDSGCVLISGHSERINAIVPSPYRQPKLGEIITLNGEDYKCTSVEIDYRSNKTLFKSKIELEFVDYYPSWRVVELIDELTSKEGCSLAFCHSNPKFDALGYKTICFGEWTGWEQKYFDGPSLMGCLKAAAEVKLSFEAKLKK